MWVIITRADGALIGQVDAVVDDNRICTNFGYFLYPSYWGQGFATEAVQAAADHLLAQRIARLTATVTVGNHASARVLQKTGFVLRRIIPNNETLRGVLFDDEEYARALVDRSMV